MTRKFKGLLEVTLDGELKMYNRAEFLKFIGQFGAGRRFTYDVAVIATGEKNWIKAYYFAEVVEKFLVGYEQHGEILDKEEAHARMKLLYPPLRIINESEQPGKRKEIKARSIMDESFSPQDFWDYIDFLSQFAAEHFDIVINPPTPKGSRQSDAIDPEAQPRYEKATTGKMKENNNFLNQSNK